jgi:hypothetical protein
MEDFLMIYSSGVVTCECNYGRFLSILYAMRIMNNTLMWKIRQKTNENVERKIRWNGRSMVFLWMENRKKESQQIWKGISDLHVNRE